MKRLFIGDKVRTSEGLVGIITEKGFFKSKVSVHSVYGEWHWASNLTVLESHNKNVQVADPSTALSKDERFGNIEVICKRNSDRRVKTAKNLDSNEYDEINKFFNDCEKVLRDKALESLYDGEVEELNGELERAYESVSEGVKEQVRLMRENSLLKTELSKASKLTEGEIQVHANLAKANVALRKKLEELEDEHDKLVLEMADDRRVLSLMSKQIKSLEKENAALKAGPPVPELPRGLPLAPPNLSMEEVERQHITHALSFYKGNKVHAANSLGISKQTLYRKLHEYGILVI